jgi:hypothetical protein
VIIQKDFKATDQGVDRPGGSVERWIFEKFLGHFLMKSEASRLLGTLELIECWAQVKTK